MLAAVLTEGWFPRPPEVMATFEKTRLKRLVNFVESLGQRRRGETAEPATLPMARLNDLTGAGGGASN